MHHTQQPSGMRRKAWRGFTLIELIVAIAVVSVATSVFLSLYFSSLGISNSARNHRVAAEVAQAELAFLQAHPEAFDWAFPESPDNARFAIERADEPPIGNPVDTPAVLPTDKNAKLRSENQYDQYSWSAFGKYPVIERDETSGEPLRYGTDYYEVTVVVAWEEKGRIEKLALTSAVPSDRVPGRVSE